MAENVLKLCAEIARINKSLLPDVEKEKLINIIKIKIREIDERASHD